MLWMLLRIILHTTGEEALVTSNKAERFARLLLCRLVLRSRQASSSAWIFNAKSRRQIMVFGRLTNLWSDGLTLSPSLSHSLWVEWITNCWKINNVLIAPHRNFRLLEVAREGRRMHGVRFIVEVGLTGYLHTFEPQQFTWLWQLNAPHSPQLLIEIGAVMNLSSDGFFNFQRETNSVFVQRKTFSVPFLFAWVWVLKTNLSEPPLFPQCWSVKEGKKGKEKLSSFEGESILGGREHKEISIPRKRISCNKETTYSWGQKFEDFAWAWAP
jgi:hypothetical protein